MSALQEAIARLTDSPESDSPESGTDEVGPNEVSQELAERVANEILSGEATPAQIGAFLIGLRIRGEKPEHLIGFARTMRDHASPVYISDPRHLVDTCGTGGDGSGSFNISTTAALIAAGAGARVAKHGNRAVTGTCGSADVLAALGVKIDASPETSAQCLAEAGIGFFFAPVFHRAMRHAGPTRKEIGVRTIFNMLGPLANPAGAKRQLIGVYDPALTEVFANVLLELGSEHVMIVHGEDGLDEITTTGKTRVTGGTKKRVHTFEIDPTQLGLPLASPDDLAGADTAEGNAEIVRGILSGESGPKADIAMLNAAAALKVAGVADSLESGLDLAREAISSGKATAALDRLAQVSNAEAE